MDRGMLSLITPKNPKLFSVALLLIGVAGLFLPTHIELGPGSVSGRVHVYLAYLGIVMMPTFFEIALPIVVLHILLTCAGALMVDRLAAKLPFRRNQ
jgi:hypothetical protein